MPPPISQVRSRATPSQVDGRHGTDEGALPSEEERAARMWSSYNSLATELLSDGEMLRSATLYARAIQLLPSAPVSAASYNGIAVVANSKVSAQHIPVNCHSPAIMQLEALTGESVCLLSTGVV